MADQYDHMVKGFAAAVYAYPVSVVETLSAEAAYQAGRRAARYAVAPSLWRQVGAKTLETAEVVELLQVTRQAVSKRMLSGSLIGLRKAGTTLFPAWQFDFEYARVRPEVRDITSTFLDELGRADPYVVASWASTPQPEDLDGSTPADWIVAGRERGVLLEAARRAAGRLAS